jgi:hypothetical protein
MEVEKVRAELQEGFVMERLLMTLGLIGVGAVGGALSGWLPLSGKTAMGLALLPLGGMALARTFC